MIERSIVEVAGELICEEHPTLEWPHDCCPGPGMPMRNALTLLAEARAEIVRLSGEDRCDDCGGSNDSKRCAHFYW